MRKPLTSHLIVDILNLAEEDQPGKEFSEKKTRTCFSVEQVCRLETDFIIKKYLTSRERAELARELGLSEQQVNFAHPQL